MMKRSLKLRMGIILLCIFLIFTVLVMCVDVQNVNHGTDIGFATFNVMFHRLIGYNKFMYCITECLSIIPIFVCIFFALLGCYQLWERKDLRKVDLDLILLGVYYGSVIFLYLFFESFPINYRPVLINGVLEASYPSSTTLLVLTVMLSCYKQVDRRVHHRRIQKGMKVIIGIFMIFMVVSRIISGVHWISDIIGSGVFSVGLFLVYAAVIENKE
ncbi:MAG: phosphatase PAP2 family protein [Erysipelotrichales bacterium]|nr:phosphatase PAP2 family protein [Erysipelotrichales bacterium]